MKKWLLTLLFLFLPLSAFAAQTPNFSCDHLSANQSNPDVTINGALDCLDEAIAAGSGGVSDHGDLNNRDVDTDGHPDIYVGYESGAGAPSAGAVDRLGYLFFDTTNSRAYFGLAPGGNYIDFGTLSDSINAVNFEGDSETCTGGNCTLTITSTGNTISGTVSKAGQVITINLESSGSFSLTVEEEDGTPSVSDVTEIKVTNGTLTDNGGGSVSIDTGGGSGSGVAEFSFSPTANEQPTSNFATLDTRNNRPMLVYADASDTSAIFFGRLSHAYGGNGLTCSVRWAAASATSGNVCWELAIERLEDEGTDLDSDSFASANFACGAAPGTNGALQYTTITFTDGADMDSLAAGENFRIKLTRDGDGTNGTDDLTENAQAFGLTCRETP